MRKLLTGLSLAPLFFTDSASAPEARPVLTTAHAHQPVLTPLPAH